MSPFVMFFLLVVALAVGIALGRAFRADRGEGTPARATPEGDPGEGNSTSLLRARALDASLEAILIVAPDGRVRDCNAAALAFFNRHRGEVIGMEAVALRRLYGADGRDLSEAVIAASRAPWMGDGLVRLPDGSTREVVTRAIPLFGQEGEVEALVEVHRDPVDDASPSTRLAGFPHSALLATGMGGERGEGGERRDLQFLAAAFHDLDKVLRQYQRLLPALRAEDPLSEVIAGVAAETTEMAQSVDVPTLLREIPVALARVDAALRQREDATRDAPPPVMPADR